MTISLSLAECQKRINVLEAQRRMGTFQHIQFEKDETIIYASGRPKIYIPTPTGKLFHASNDFVNLVIGPYGSGKSTLCVNHIVRSTCAMPIWHQGRRRSRWAIVRNTSGELQSTT